MGWNCFCGELVLLIWTNSIKRPQLSLASRLYCTDQSVLTQFGTVWSALVSILAIQLGPTYKKVKFNMQGPNSLSI
jgi:hypothetical protein